MACPSNEPISITINVEELENNTSGTDQILSRFWVVSEGFNCDEERFAIVVVVGELR